MWKWGIVWPLPLPRFGNEPLPISIPVFKINHIGFHYIHYYRFRHFGFPLPFPFPLLLPLLLPVS